jgi:hypothetical protein
MTCRVRRSTVDGGVVLMLSGDIRADLAADFRRS